MPRPSSNPEKTRSGGGIENGNYECLRAEYRNIKTERRPNQPNLVLGCAVLDKDGDRVRGADEVEMFFPFGEKSLEAFHPGECSGPDDSDPKDCGTDVDASGNTIFCEDDTAQFNRSCGAIVFNESLVKQGYPKETLDQTYAPNYVGLKFELMTLASKEVNDKLGTRLNTKPTADGGTVTYKVATKWLNPKYLNEARDSKGAGKGGVKANGSAASEGAAAAAASSDPEEIAASMIARVAGVRSGPKNVIKSVQQLVGLATVEVQKAQVKIPLNKLQKYWKDEAWLAPMLMGMNAKVTFSDDTTDAYDNDGNLKGVKSVEFAAAS